MKTDKFPCNCKMPEKWSKDPHFPLEYDAALNEFNIVHGEARNFRTPILYCPYCGGRLPESKRDTFFVRLDETEEKQMQELMTRVCDVESMRNILGEPDRSYESLINEEQRQLYEMKKWKRQYTYESRWRTLCLYIFERDDGSVQYSWAPKEKSADR